MSDLLPSIGRLVAEAGGPAYFVGGCVRDMLRGEAIKDVDFVVSGDTHAAGRAIVGRYGGHVFWLRQEDEVTRVFLPEQDGLQIDFTRLRGPIEEDLLARDLTVNAMAVPAEAGLRPDAPILDPSGGQADLDARIVRFVAPSAPENDPLRVLRAFRFRWKLDFRMTEETAARIRECAPLLARVSTERVRDELFQLLAIPSAAEALEECLGAGLGRWLWGREVASPEGEGSPLPALRVRSLLELLPGIPTEYADLLETEPTPPRRRREVLLWAGALQPLAPPLEPAEAARYLALSNEERQIIAKALAVAPVVAELAARWPVPGRERRRVFKAAGPAGPEAVLLAAAGTREWTQAHRDLLEEALDRLLRPQAPLLSGTDIMSQVGLKPGPEVGRLMEAIEDARADGLLTSPGAARDWVKARLEAPSGREV